MCVCRVCVLLDFDVTVVDNRRLYSKEVQRVGKEFPSRIEKRKTNTRIEAHIRIQYSYCFTAHANQSAYQIVFSSSHSHIPM